MTNPFEEYTPAVRTDYPPSLPHDLACAMTPEEVEVLRTKYSLEESEFDYIVNLPLFKREYAEWRQRLITEGNSFKLKLRAMSEEFLPTAHHILHSDLTAPSVKVDLFKYITKVAELEPVPEKQSQSDKSTSTRLVISWEDGKGQVALETSNG